MTMEPPDFTNHSNYLLDKLDCIKNASQNLEIMDLKDKFIGQIESECFDNRTQERLNELNKFVHKISLL